jgi:hypothetical protein
MIGRGKDYPRRCGKFPKQRWLPWHSVTALLTSISNEAFADSFQKLCERCQRCVVKDGDYVEAQ